MGCNVSKQGQIKNTINKKSQQNLPQQQFYPKLNGQDSFYMSDYTMSKRNVNKDKNDRKIYNSQQMQRRSQQSTNYDQNSNICEKINKNYNKNYDLKCINSYNNTTIQQIDNKHQQKNNKKLSQSAIMEEDRCIRQNFNGYQQKKTSITHFQSQNYSKILEQQNMNVKNQQEFFDIQKQENLQNINREEKNQKNSEYQYEIFDKNSNFSSEQNQDSFVQLQNYDFNQHNIRICGNNQQSSFEDAYKIEVQQNSMDDDQEFKKINDKMIQIYENQIGKQKLQLEQLSKKLPSYVILEEYFQQKKEFLRTTGQAVPVLNNDISDSFLILKRELHIKAIMIKKLKEQAEINQHIEQSLYTDIQVSDKVIKDIYQL